MFPDLWESLVKKREHLHLARIPSDLTSINDENESVDVIFFFQSFKHLLWIFEIFPLRIAVTLCIENADFLSLYIEISFLS